jgi:predicted O-methyltransferase YrrM
MIPNQVLQEMLVTGMARDASGAQRQAHSGIDSAATDALYRTVRARRPSRVLEIGMAHGFSTLAALTALQENGKEGSLVSIDPSQSTHWGGVGVANVTRAGLADRHRLIEDYDYLALPELLRQGTAFDLVYIDGVHEFEYVCLDFFYADKLLLPGGCIGFNDCGMADVHLVAKRVESLPHYRRIDVGLPRSFKGRNVLYTAARWAMGRAVEDRYFEKVCEKAETASNRRSEPALTT